MRLLKILKLWPPFEDTDEVAPEVPGAELALGTQRTHYALTKDRTHFALTNSRPHYRVEEE